MFNKNDLYFLYSVFMRGLYIFPRATSFLFGGPDCYLKVLFFFCCVDQIMAQEQVLELLPMVGEANAVSEELDKKM